jgi:hypothetical protein
VPTQESDEYPIDPLLLEQTRSLREVVMNPDHAHDDFSLQMESVIFDQVASPQSTSESMLTSDTLSFVLKYSTINISCNQSLVTWGKRAGTRREITLANLEGNSRDEVTSFLYPCKNSVFGCNYSNAFRVALVGHEQSCELTSKEALARRTAEAESKQFKCTRGDCTRRYDSERMLKRHIKDIHDYMPSPCSKGCDPKVLYPTRAALQKHLESHSQFTPTACRVEGCTEPTIFERSKIYRKHIQRTHGIKGKDIDQYMPYTKEKFQPTQCKYSGCKSKATFSLPNQYRQHLRDKHGVSEEEMAEYVSARIGWSRKKAKAVGDEEKENIMDLNTEEEEEE